MRSKIGPLIAVLTIALAVPATALAHHVTSFTANCTSAQVVVASFGDYNKPVSYVVTVDNQPQAVTPASPWTFTGSNATLNLTFVPVLAAGNHVVKIVATWPGQYDSNGTFYAKVLNCTGPPVPPVVTPPTVTPPAATPPVATPPVATPPVATPPVVTPTVQRPVTVKHRKVCTHGRVHLIYKHGPKKGRHFTLCRVLHVPKVVTPKFTG